jgi:dynein heavy chain
MALTARHRFLIQRISSSLLPAHPSNDSLVESWIRSEPILNRVNSLFSPEGIQKLVFKYYEPGAGDVPTPPIEEEDGKEEKEGEAAALAAGDLSAFALVGDVESGWLLCTQGHDVALTGRAIFFMKTHPSKGIDPTKSNDAAMTHGVITDPMRSLEVVMRNVYKPLLTAQQASSWGQAPPAAVNEMMVGVDTFVHNLAENLKSLNSGLELRKPEPAYEALGASASGEPQVVASYMELLEEWCTRIDRYLDDSDRSRWETNDSGPDSELEYWRRRMQRLTSITDQLKTRSCKTVIGVLTAVTRLPEDIAIDKQRTLTLVRQWKQIDLNITEAANEAKDNVK